MSKAKTAETNSQQSQSEFPKEEQQFEEEMKFDEEDVEYKPNPIVLWIKRIIKAILLFGVANVTYASLQKHYYPDLNLSIFEIDPIYRYSQKIIEAADHSYKFLTEPPMMKFLPDKLPMKTEVAKKTVVLNFEGTLYAKDFKTNEGIVIHLRPGYQKFIEHLAMNFDVVLYSDEDTNFMGEVLQTIDPYQRYIQWYYGREFMNWSRKGPMKNLKYVNRDIRKVIVVDMSRNLYNAHTENVILLDQYKGEENDTALRDLTLFLDHLADPKVKDVRKEIEKYGGENAVKNYYEMMVKKLESVKKKRGGSSGPKIKSWFN